MTLMGQSGERQDPPKGVQMLKIAAERADENAPQGAYVRYPEKVFISTSFTNYVVGSRYAIRT